MAMDIIFQKNIYFNENNNFSIYLKSNNEIQEMFFKGKDEWLMTGLDLKIRPLQVEDLEEYKDIKKLSNLIKKAKSNKKNIIKHGDIETKLPNSLDFEQDELVCYNKPVNKTYEYYNTDTKRMDTITFPDYKKWYKENNAVWDSRAYGHSQLKIEHVNDNLARKTLKRRDDSSSTDERYINILESMNKIYTKVGDTVNQSTDWVHYFYKNVK